ncbi:MAG: YcnI family protein [Alphaproteobacteria bacterium]
MSVRLLRMAAPAVLLAGAPAAAHITLETAAAPAGSYYKAVFRVGHGCKGSPTTAIRVRIPDGASGVKPQPKPGWQVATVKDEAHGEGAHAGHGGHAGAGVREVVWTGKLLDEHYDEFVIRLKLPDTPGAALLFPVVQTCAKGEQRWVETAEPGKPAVHDRMIAPLLRLTPKP